MVHGVHEWHGMFTFLQRGNTSFAIVAVVRFPGFLQWTGRLFGSFLSEWRGVSSYHAHQTGTFLSLNTRDPL